MIEKKGQLDMEILEEPGFWILGGGAVFCTIAGYIISKRISDLPTFPLWQLFILIIVEVIAAAVFASRG